MSEHVVTATPGVYAAPVQPRRRQQIVNAAAILIPFFVIFLMVVVLRRDAEVVTTTVDGHPARFAYPLSQQMTTGLFFHATWVFPAGVACTVAVALLMATLPFHTNIRVRICGYALLLGSLACGVYFAAGVATDAATADPEVRVAALSRSDGVSVARYTYGLAEHSDSGSGGALLTLCVLILAAAYRICDIWTRHPGQRL